MPTPKRSISSRVAKQNPRPRKYATAAERQKALRERFPTLCVRVEQEQADFMKRIADEQGRTLQDVHLAFIKYANGRGNQWLTQGLKGFAPLPRFEETPKENPTMKRKPTPAQIAARERFAEMARSGAFKKKAKRNPAKKRIAAPDVMPGGKTVYKRYSIIHPTSGEWFYIVREGVNIGSARSLNEAKSLIDMLTEGLPNPRASNPIILVSDKAIASKRKRNPQAPSIKHKGARNIAYAVEAKRMIAGGGAQFEMIAGFPTKAQAQDYIDALLKSYPKGLTLRISAA